MDQDFAGAATESASEPAALLARADAVRALTRDGERVIVTARQTRECLALAEKALHTPGLDTDARTRAEGLRAQATAAATHGWSEVPRAIALAVVCAAVGIGGPVLGGVDGDLTFVAVTGALGSAGLLGVVVAHRVPGWRRTADLLWPVLTHPGE